MDDGGSDRLGKARSVTLLQRIERHLRTTGVSATRFGRETMGDPRFVHDMRRMHREPYARTEAKLIAAMRDREGRAI